MPKYKSSILLKIVDEGVKLELVSVAADCQQKHPRYYSRLQEVKELLKSVIGSEQVEAYLQARPLPVRFRNRVSAKVHERFVETEIQGLLQAGAIKQFYPGCGDEDPLICHGIGVVVNRKGKKRLILDCRYLNVFLRHQSFHYERLQDVFDYLQKNDYVSTTDFKSGYHSLRMHKAAWPFLGFRFQNRTYFFTHLPFGVASACKIYTELVTAMYMPLRAAGEMMTAVIDDMMLSCKQQGQTMYHIKTVIMLFGALGMFLSDKSMLQPAQSARFLGFTLNTTNLLVSVPLDKLDYVKTVLHQARCLGLQDDYPAASSSVSLDKLDQVRNVLVQALKKRAFTPRDIASIAGTLASLAPAMPMGSIYHRCAINLCKYRSEFLLSFKKYTNERFELRGLYEAMKERPQPPRAQVERRRGGLSDLTYWDLPVLHPKLVEPELRFWLANLDRFNGRRWQPRSQVITIVGDMSDKAFAGYTTESELALPIVVPFTVEQNDAARQHLWSSTARETENALVCVETLLQAMPNDVSGKRVHYVGDNQASISNLSKMGGEPKTFAAVRTFHELCFDWDVEVSFEWRPRGDSLIQYADMLSKIQDPGAVYLRPHMRYMIMRKWGVPSLDVFASSGDGMHVVDRFYTQFYEPKALAVDALAQSWTGEFVWAFPPPRQEGRTLQKIIDDACNAIAILPRGKGHPWIAFLKHMPVKDVMPIPGNPKEAYTLGPCHPRYDWQDLRLPLDAYLIVCSPQTWRC